MLFRGRGLPFVSLYSPHCVAANRVAGPTAVRKERRGVPRGRGRGRRRCLSRQAGQVRVEEALGGLKPARYHRRRVTGAILVFRLCFEESLDFRHALSRDALPSRLVPGHGTRDTAFAGLQEALRAYRSRRSVILFMSPIFWPSGSLFANTSQ